MSSKIIADLNENISGTGANGSRIQAEKLLEVISESCEQVNPVNWK